MDGWVDGWSMRFACCLRLGVLPQKERENIENPYSTYPFASILQNVPPSLHVSMSSLVFFKPLSQPFHMIQTKPTYLFVCLLLSAPPTFSFSAALWAPIFKLAPGILTDGCLLWAAGWFFLSFVLFLFSSLLPSSPLFSSLPFSSLLFSSLLFLFSILSSSLPFYFSSRFGKTSSSSRLSLGRGWGVCFFFGRIRVFSIFRFFD